MINPAANANQSPFSYIEVATQWVPCNICSQYGGCVNSSQPVTHILQFSLRSIFWLLRHIFVLLNLNVDGFCTAKPECGWMEGTLQWSANQTSKQLLQSSEMGLLGVLLPAVCCFFLIQVVFGAYQRTGVPVKFCSHLFWLLWWRIRFLYDPFEV